MSNDSTLACQHHLLAFSSFGSPAAECVNLTLKLSTDPLIPCPIAPKDATIQRQCLQAPTWPGLLRVQAIIAGPKITRASIPKTTAAVPDQPGVCSQPNLSGLRGRSIIHPNLTFSCTSPLFSHFTSSQPPLLFEAYYCFRAPLLQQHCTG